MEDEYAIVKWLKRLFSLQTVGVLAGILSAYIAYKSYEKAYPDSQLFSFFESKSELFDKAYNYSKEGNYIDALIWYKKAADKGSYAAMNNIGSLYENGKGVNKDLKTALEWYKKAAEGGDDYGLTNLGRFYYYGYGGLEENKEEAVRLYRKAAEGGDKRAQYFLAYCLHFGNGTAKDEEESVTWYRKAAEQGHPDAEYWLGECLFWGWGTNKDCKEGFIWYKKAAEHGVIKAMDRLGDCYGTYYYEDVGLKKKDYVEAIKWYKKAEKEEYSSQLSLKRLREYAREGDEDVQYALRMNDLSW